MNFFRPEALKAHSSVRWGRPVGLLPMAWSRIVICPLCISLFISGCAVSTPSENKQGDVDKLSALDEIIAIATKTCGAKKAIQKVSETEFVCKQ